MQKNPGAYLVLSLKQFFLLWPGDDMRANFVLVFSCQPWQFSSGGHALLVRRSFVFVLLSMISCKSPMSYIPIRIPMALASPVWP